MRSSKSFPPYQIIGVLIILLVCIVSLFRGMSSYFSSLGDEKWKQRTTPLHQDVINDICKRLSVPDKPICQNKQVVYAPDFFPIIASVFEHKDITYQIVQSKIQKYQVELEPLIIRKDGSTYFVSMYDLRGDKITSIAFFFDGNYLNNTLIKIDYHYDRFGF